MIQRILPLNNPYITSEYGIVRSDNKVHTGLDIISKSSDRNVKAICDGFVSYVGYDPLGFGKYVSIQLNDNLRVLYCHLEEVFVEVGKFIFEGQVIGIEGSTGKTTGIHLHLEIREFPYTNKNHINIAEYFKIKNEKGFVTKREISREEKISFIKEKVGLDDNTMKYFEFYRYSNELIEKLYKTLKNNA